MERDSRSSSLEFWRRLMCKWVVFFATIVAFLNTSNLECFERSFASSLSKIGTEHDVEAFHNASLARRRQLVNSSSVMIWKTRVAFPNFYGMWEDIGNYLDSKNVDAQWADPNCDLLVSHNLCSALKSFHMLAFGNKSHVLLTRLYENFGAASTSVPGRVKGFYGVDSLKDRWNEQNCTEVDVMAYLNNDHVKAVFVTSHQFTDHGKMHSIPIGIRNAGPLLSLLEGDGGQTPAKKTQLLMLNVRNESPFNFRKKVVTAVIERFNGTVVNTYGSSLEEYLNEIQRSKFVLCPSGVGFDTYRAWETLYMGSFPIVERGRTDGFYRVFDDLPVLFVDNMLTDVTPELLESAYPRLASTKRHYRYEKLTKQYWFDYVNSLRPSSVRKDPG